MLDPPRDDLVLSTLTRWGERRSAVRTMILTSTRAVPGARVDFFSDYDVVVAVTDVRPFHDDRSWLDDFGRVLVVYRDPMRKAAGGERFAFITQYENGLKIDFTVCATGVLSRLARAETLPEDLDVGYAVLLDKDGLTQTLADPTHSAFVPSPPDETAYGELIEEFFHEATYVAKHLWRDDLLPAKYNLDHAMKQVNLRRMLEWRIGTEHDWALPTRAYGKGLKQMLPADTWRELKAAYAGGDIEQNWAALFRTIALFRRVAGEVGGRLGFTYPEDLDARVTRYLEEVRRLGHGPDR
jgi:aminoglycoside 6-adenylyltransferase